MYERMLDKSVEPSQKEFIEYCGQTKNLLNELDEFLTATRNAEKLLRFPYGNSYGWGMKYFIKSKHICDVFAEKDAFTIMMRLTNAELNKDYDSYSDYTKKIIDNKYPCGQGGWIHYRVLSEQNLNDIKNLLSIKVKK